MRLISGKVTFQILLKAELDRTFSFTGSNPEQKMENTFNNII